MCFDGNIFKFKCVKFTFKNGIGNPMSTLRKCMHSFDDVMSVSFFKESLKALSTSSFSVKSVSTIWPVILSVRILVFAEFRILHIVEVDSLFLPLKILFSNILLISVDFPALVSPKSFYLNNYKQKYRHEHETHAKIKIKCLLMSENIFSCYLIA